MGVIITGVKTVQSELYKCIYHNNCRWDLQDLLPDFWEPQRSPVDEHCYRGDAFVSFNWLEKIVQVKQVNEFLLLKMFETDLLVDPDSTETGLDSNKWQRRDLFDGCCF